MIVLEWDIKELHDHSSHGWVHPPIHGHTESR